MILSRFSCTGSKRKRHFHYCSNMKRVFRGLIRDFPAARSIDKAKRPNAANVCLRDHVGKKCGSTVKEMVPCSRGCCLITRSVSAKQQVNTVQINGLRRRLWAGWRTGLLYCIINLSIRSSDIVFYYIPVQWPCVCPTTGHVAKVSSPAGLIHKHDRMVF